jgi:hypothetical protein
VTGEKVPIPSAADDKLRAAFASVAEVAGAEAACPTVDVLWDSAAERCDRRQLESVILHMGECTACAAAWRLARELRRDQAGARVLAGPAQWFRRSWVQVAALAAVLVFAAGVAVQLRTASRDVASEFRGQEGDWIRSLVPEGKVLTRERCLLRWTPGPVHTVYDVRVTTEDLVPLARIRGSERPEFLVPSASLGRVPSGARIVWQVTARLPDARITDSSSFVNEVR